MRDAVVQLASHDRFGFLFSSAPLAPAGPSNGHERAYACAARAFAPNLRRRAQVSRRANNRARIPLFGSVCSQCTYLRVAPRRSRASAVGGIRGNLRKNLLRALPVLIDPDEVNVDWRAISRTFTRDCGIVRRKALCQSLRNDVNISRQY